MKKVMDGGLLKIFLDAVNPLPRRRSLGLVKLASFPSCVLECMAYAM